MRTTRPLLFLSLRGRGGRVIPLSVLLRRGGHLLVVSKPGTNNGSIYLGAIKLLRCVLRYNLLVPMCRDSGAKLFRGLFVSVKSRRDVRGSLDACDSRLAGVGFFIGGYGDGALVLVSRFNDNARPRVKNTVTRTLLSHFGQGRDCNIVAARCRGLGRFTGSARKVIGNTVLCSHRLVRPLFGLSVNGPKDSFTIRVTQGVNLPRSIVTSTSTGINSSCVGVSGCLRSVIHSGHC